MMQSFKLRSTVIFLLFIACYVLISINLYIIQIKYHNFYKKLANKQYNVTTTHVPSRGPIFDRTGINYLAMNKNYIAAFILPTQMINKNKTFDFLKNNFPHAFARLQKNENKRFMFIKRRLSLEEITLINAEKNPDILFLSEPGRYYPLACISTIIGLTDIDNKGLLGIELLYNNFLAGKPTTCHLEKDARSGYHYFKKETTVQGNEGNPLILTIDADLQFLAQQMLQQTTEKFNAKEAAAIIMNPYNGEIIVMASYPYFDPNDSYTLCDNNHKNKIITDAYELGSVMKICTALAALEEEVVTPDELIDCKNSLTAHLDGRTINTIQAHGIITFADVIALSNNIGIAIVAKRLDTKLYDHYKRLGFGAKTGIKFPGENSGFINPPEKWSKQSIISLAYGYEVSATILQIARLLCVIATGYHVEPILILPSPNEQKLPQHHTEKPLYRDESRAAIKNILERTTLHGTTRKAAIKGYRVMSKTGTANMLIHGKYDPDKNLFCCAGIVEKDHYQRVIVTFVKEAQQKNIYAATVAAPLFEQIAERMLIHDKIIS